MSYSIEVSNAAGINYNLPMYLKDKQDNSYLQDFMIPAYALNHKLDFHSEDEFNKWKSQYKDYIEGKEAVIKVGKSSGHSLEKQNKNIEKENSSKIKEDQNKIKSKDDEAGIKTNVEASKQNE